MEIMASPNDAAFFIFVCSVYPPKYKTNIYLNVDHNLEFNQILNAIEYLALLG